MTAPNQKTVIVLGGPTGPTGTYERVNIVPNFTGATGEIAQWRAATGATGPNGTFKSVVNIGPTGPNPSRYKTVIIPGFSSGGAGSTFDPATNVGGTLSNNNLTWLHDGVTNNAGVKLTTFKTTGKWYFEAHIDVLGSNNLFGVGGLLHTAAISTETAGLGSAGAAAYFNNGPIFVNGAQPGNVTFNGGQRTPALGDTIGVGIDVGAKTIQLKNITTGGLSSGLVTMVSEVDYTAAVFAGTADSPAGKVTINLGATAFLGTPFAGYSAWG